VLARLYAGQNMAISFRCHRCKNIVAFELKEFTPIVKIHDTAAVNALFFRQLRDLKLASN